MELRKNEKETKKYPGRGKEEEPSLVVNTLQHPRQQGEGLAYSRGKGNWVYRRKRKRKARGIPSTLEGKTRERPKQHISAVVGQVVKSWKE